MSSSPVRYLLHFAFRASSFVPLYEAVLAPLFEAPGAADEGSDSQAVWKQVLHDPALAFKKDGEMHR